MPISGQAAVRGRRFAPALWPSVAALVVIVATVLLGNWQARRADYRGGLQDQARAMGERAPLEVRRAADIAPASRYRPAAADGEYVADRQVLLDNRTHNGTAGYQVLTPLKLNDGSHLLVARGWIASTGKREPPAPMPPAGRVKVTGRLNAPPGRFLELKHTEPVGAVWQNLDLSAYAKATGLTIAPLVLEQSAGDPDGLLRDWPSPDLGRDKNIGYMWQWYGFATLTALLWLVLSWRKDDGK